MAETCPKNSSENCGERHNHAGDAKAAQGCRKCNLSQHGLPSGKKKFFYFFVPNTPMLSSAKKDTFCSISRAAKLYAYQNFGHRIGNSLMGDSSVWPQRAAPLRIVASSNRPSPESWVDLPVRSNGENYFFLPPPLPPPPLESVTLRLIRLDQSVASPAATARTRK